MDIIFDPGTEVANEFKKSIQYSQTDHATEISIRSKTNRPVDTLWSIRWSDAESQFFCVSRDITERKRLDQLRNDLVTMVSHDLRSPLTAIIVGLQHLGSGASGEVGPPIKRYLDRIENSASRTVRLVNDFLDLEKIQSGMLELNIIRTNLDVIVCSSVQAIRSLADAADITIEERGTDHDLMVDGDRIVQVLVNLLGNAIKYSPRGEQIIIAAEAIENGIEISVTDQGPGIAEEKQNAIFDRYIQVDEKTSAYPSTGLGLAICKNLVELHGGTIGVRSTPGNGSTFWFRLPRSACCYLSDADARS